MREEKLHKKQKKHAIRNHRQKMKQAISMELREHKSSFAVYFVLRIMVIAILVLQIFNRNYENVFLCVLTLVLLVIPSFVQVNFRIELPTPLEIMVLLFIFAAEILGEIRAFYIIYPFWDTMLHTINGFLAAAIGFSLVDLLNREERFSFKLSPVFLAIVAFCFSMTIGVLWEFFECAMDMFLGFDMQKDTVINTISTVMLDPTGGNTPTSIKNITSVVINGQDLGLGGYLDIGLLDTMKDMFVNFIGAVVFSIIGYIYVKNRGKDTFAGGFIPRKKKKEADFLTILEENKIKTIIFDIGKVLVDFDYRNYIKDMFEDEETYQAVVKATVQSPAWRELDRGVMTDSEILQAFIKNDEKYEKEIRYFFHHLEGIVKLRDYSVPWVQELKEKGYQVLVLSNISDRIMHMCKEELKFMEYVDGGILSYQEKTIKPEKEIYEILIERYQLEPSQCVFMDDQIDNINMAQELGLHAFVFTTQKDARKQLKKLDVI